MDLRSGRKLTGTFAAEGGFLGDLTRVARFCKELVETIKMRPLGSHYYDVPIALARHGIEPEHDEGGVTAVVVLSTSHLALHTWPEENGARIDIDSCRGFEDDPVYRLLREHFDATEIDLYDVSHVFRKGKAHDRPTLRP